MDVANINPFIQATQTVCATICGEAPSLGKLFAKAKPYTTQPVSITVGVIGDIAGEVVYTMTEAAVCFIASKMMGGMPVVSLDEMAQSAVSEMANMISGNVATLFSGKGIKLDITPPLFRLNAATADFPRAAELEKIISIPLGFANGAKIELDILFK